VGALPIHASDLFLRGGIGRERSESAVLRDRDCTSTLPPALFGCGFEARGELDDAMRREIGIGLHTSRGRVELAFSDRDLDFVAESNFTGVEGAQPVTARGRSRSAMVIGTLEFGRQPWKPFVTLGAGAANHQLDDVTFAFPGIAPDAVTVIRGGDHMEFAWMAGAGVAIPISERVHVDLAIRHHNEGQIRTDAGAATIVRPRGTFVIDIDGTRVDAESTEIMLSLRYRL
jgi:opacity protein-like surface antigen